MFPAWFPFGQVRASASARAAALESACIEELAGPEGVPTFVAGGRMTKGALPMTTPILDAALYSSRGRGYAPYNEDAAGLFKDKSGRLFAFVLDQAGGLGGRIRGQASELAAKEIFAAQSVLAKKGHTKKSLIEDALLKGLMAGHQALVARKEGEVSTAVAAVVDAQFATIVNSGDSGALHFDKTGRNKLRTTMHEAAPPNEGCLLHALGLQPEGPAPDAYGLTLEPGDWVLLASDGLLDAALPDDVFYECLATAENAEDAVNKLVTQTLRRMSTLRAKPDNLTVLAIRSLGKTRQRKQSLDAMG